MKLALITILLTIASFAQANHDSTEWVDAPLVKIDLNKLKAGEPEYITWANQAVFVLKPSEKQLKDLATIPDESLGDKNDKNTTLNAFAKRFENGIEQILFQSTSSKQRYRNDVIVLVQASPYFGCYLHYNQNINAQKPPRILKDYLSSSCHGVYFDIRGRVIKPHELNGSYNIAIPPFEVSDDKLIIGNVYNFDKSLVEKEVLIHKQTQTKIKTGLDFYNAIGKGNIDLIKKHIESNRIDWNKEIHLQYKPLTFAFMIKHFDVVKLFINNGATFDEFVPSGHKLGCIAQYFEPRELEQLYDIGLNAKKGYCKVESSCFEPPLFQFIGRQGKQREIDKIKLAIQNGFRIDESYCGRSLVDIIQDNDRPGMTETLMNYQRSIIQSD